MTTNTTTNLKLALRRWYNNPIVWIFAVANLFVVVAAGASIGRYDPSTVIANLPTPEIIVLVATAPPVPTPAGITVAAVQPVKYVTAFAAPAGDLLGPIPAPEASAIVARFGDDWLMTTWNGGPAWVRAADVGLRIADLKPERVVVVSAGDGGNTPAPRLPGDERRPAR